MAISSVMRNLNIPNIDPDEFAVVVIGGPSLGESVLLHYGDGKWIIVDSCTYRGVNLPLFFLEKVHADLDLVGHVICSHWHDDHVAGMSTLLEKCKYAYFRLPLISNDYVLPQIFVFKTERSVKENEKKAWEMFKACLDKLNDRDDADGVAYKDKYYVKLEDSIEDYQTHGTRVDIKAFSPSTEMIDRFGQMLVNGNADALEFDDSQIEPNFCSIALGVRFGNNERHLFVGADLECNRDGDDDVDSCDGDCENRHAIGMCNVICNRYFEQLRQISYTKIIHHSSKTGYCPKYWNEYVTADNIGVSTAFTPQNLPRKDMATRYYAKVSQYFLTSRKPQRNLNKAEIKKILGDNKYVTSMRQIDTTPGIIVTRYDLASGDYKGTDKYLNAFQVSRNDLQYF